MKRKEAFQVIGRHIYIAHLRLTLDGEIVILADCQEEAEEKARLHFGLSNTIVKRVIPTQNAQVYKL